MTPESYNMLKNAMETQLKSGILKGPNTRSGHVYLGKEFEELMRVEEMKRHWRMWD